MVAKNRWLGLLSTMEATCVPWLEGKGFFTKCVSREDLPEEVAAGWNHKRWMNQRAGLPDTQEDAVPVEGTS